jgi:hypothetical protein
VELVEKPQTPQFRIPALVLAAGTSGGAKGWARSVLLDAGAIRKCEEHGWMRDRSDPHAREHALLVARQDPPPGVSPDEATAAVEDVLGSIGDTCPECPLEE